MANSGPKTLKMLCKKFKISTLSDKKRKGGIFNVTPFFYLGSEGEARSG